MRKRLLAVSVLSVLLASCGGSGSGDSGTTADVPGNAGDGSDAPSGEDNGDNPAEGDNGESPAAGDNGGTATGGDVLYTGEVVAANNCVLDTLSLTDSEYDVYLDAPKFTSFRAISDRLLEEGITNADDITVNVAMVSLGNVMLAAGGPATYTNNTCNHSLFLSGECGLLGAEVNASLSGEVLTTLVEFPDGTTVDYTINSADNSSGSMIFTDGRSNDVQTSQWDRSNGVETFSYTTEDADIVFEELADCSGSAQLTSRDNGTVDLVVSTSWTSPRNSDFQATLETCDYDDGLVTCNTVIRP